MNGRTMMKKIIMTMLILMGMQQTVSAEIRNMDIAATVVGVGGTVWALKLRSEYKAVEAQAAKLKKNKASMRPEEYKQAMSNLHEEYVQLKRRCKQVAYTTGTVVAAYAAYRGYQWRVQVAEAAVQAERERVENEAYAAAHAAPGVAARAPGAEVLLPEGLLRARAMDREIDELVAAGRLVRPPGAAVGVAPVAAAGPAFQAFGVGVEAALAGGVPAAAAVPLALAARRAPAAAGGRRAVAAPARPVAPADLAAIRWEEGDEEAGGGALMAGLAADPQVQALVAQFGDIGAILRDPEACAQLQAMAAGLGAAMGGFVAAAGPILEAFGGGVDAGLAGGVPAARAPAAAAAPALGGARAPAALGDRR